MADTSDASRGSREHAWEDGDVDLPTPRALADAFTRHLTGDEADGGHERTATRRTDGLDRYERSVVVVGRVHRSVVEVRVSSAGRVVVAHRLVREREGLLGRLLPRDPDARRGVDAETLEALRSEQRSILAEAVDERLVRAKTTDRLAGFVLGFETARSAPPPRSAEATGLSDYLSIPYGTIVSRIVAVERRAQS